MLKNCHSSSLLCCCLQGGETRKDQMAEEHGGDASAGYSEMGHQVHLVTDSACLLHTYECDSLLHTVVWALA
jgi:hypothetical protein